MDRAWPCVAAIRTMLGKIVLPVRLPLYSLVGFLPVISSRIACCGSCLPRIQTPSCRRTPPSWTYRCLEPTSETIDFQEAMSLAPARFPFLVWSSSRPLQRNCRRSSPFFLSPVVLQVLLFQAFRCPAWISWSLAIASLLPRCWWTVGPHRQAPSASIRTPGIWLSEWRYLQLVDFRIRLLSFVYCRKSDSTWFAPNRWRHQLSEIACLYPCSSLVNRR